MTADLFSQLKEKIKHSKRKLTSNGNDFPLCVTVLCYSVAKT